MRAVKQLLSLILVLALIGTPGFPPAALAAGANASTPQTHPNTYVNTGDQRKDILAVALTQVGYVEASNNNTKYGAALNINELAWCGAFVSWCALEAGVPDSVLTKTGVANPSAYRLTPKTYPAYTPQPGDLFFAPDNTHVGLVHYVEGNYIHTIEGNVKLDGVEGVHLFKRKLTDVVFGAPAYQNKQIVISSGACGAQGSNLTWTLDDRGMLFISGTGAMADYTAEDHSPWYQNSAVETVILQHGVTTIGDHAFDLCTNLSTVTIPETVVSVGDYAFSSCESLTNLTLPNSITTIGEWVFINSAVASLNIPASVSTIGDYAFFRDVDKIRLQVDPKSEHFCMKDSILYSKDMTRLIYCTSPSMGAYSIPDTVTTIGAAAFYACGITQITFPEGLKTIGAQSFYSAYLTEVDIPDSVETIDLRAFWWCDRLASVNIGSSVKTIGSEAFFNCWSLESVTIPASVTKLGCAAFDCAEVYFEGSAPEVLPFYLNFDPLPYSENIYYYPDDTWTPESMQSISRQASWVPLERSSPIKSILFHDITIPECYPSFFLDNCYVLPSITATVTLWDGQTEVIEGHFDYDAESYPITHNAAELQSETPWTVGTYTVTGTLMGVSSTFNVTIEATPIEALTIEDLSLIEGSLHYDAEENYLEFANLNGYASLNDGKTASVLAVGEGYTFGPSLIVWGEYNYLLRLTPETDPRSWVTGNTYAVTASIPGLIIRDTFYVSYLENPVQSIHYHNQTLYKDIDYQGSETDFLAWIEPQVSSVLLKDGSYAQLTERGILYMGQEYIPNAAASFSWQISDNTYLVAQEFLGVTNSYQVTFQENPIQQLEIAKMPDRSSFLPAEIPNIYGAVIRIRYTDGTCEEITFDNNYPKGYLQQFYSQKLDRTTTVHVHHDVDEAGAPIIVVQLFEKSCQLSYTVSSQQMKSISIQEAADKTILISACLSDGTTTQMTLLDIPELWLIEDNTFSVSFQTDKGLFSGEIYAENDTFAIAFYNEEYEPLRSNTLPGCDWFRLVRYLPSELNNLIPFENAPQRFSGTLTAENIDAIIQLAAQFDQLLEDLPSNKALSGNAVRAAVTKYFGINFVDLSLSQYYDAKTDTYTPAHIPEQQPGGIYYKSLPTQYSYRDGIWTVTCYLGYSVQDRVRIKLQLDSDFRILSYVISKGEVPGDMTNDGFLTNDDVVYLLWHVLFGNEYPLSGNADFTGDAAIGNDDVVYLLWHLLFGDEYPLT